VKKTVNVFVILLLLLSAMGYVTSKPINSRKSNDPSHFYENDIINIEQDIEVQDINSNPKAIQLRSLADSPWPMFHQNLNHTGVSPYNTSANQGNLLWKFPSGAVQGSPIIGPNGVIYFGSKSWGVYAIYPNGTQKWMFPTGHEIRGAPAIDSYGIVYIGSQDKNVYAIYPNGTEKWNFTTGGGVWSGPAIDSSGTIYIGSSDLYAIYPNGTQKWTFIFNNGMVSVPAIGVDGTIYFTGDNKLYAIDSNGNYKWDFPTGNGILSSPAIGSDGTIYFGSHDHRFYAVNPDGTEKWSKLFWGEVSSSPAIGSDGTIYIGDKGSQLYAYYPNGTMKWFYKTGDDIRSSPAIGSDGTIYVGSYDYNIYAINPNGTKKWNFTTGDQIYSSPAIGSDGTIYIGSEDGYFYAIGNKLSFFSGKVEPLNGNTNTSFNYTVSYLHRDNKAPISINISIDQVYYDMIETDVSDTNYLDGKEYFYNIPKLDIGIHNFQFWASDGDCTIFSEVFYKPIVLNTNPNITNPDNKTAIEDTYYEIIYQYEDIDLANVGQIGTWDYSTNATWLNFNPTTAMLYGTPTNDDVGSYWVNISINDTIDMDFTNFTLTVINENDNPIIETTDVEITYEDELYEVDYNATDVDSPNANQIWSLDTNATTWLGIDIVTGIISGIPTNDEVGEYWVNVSVDDGDSGLAFSNYTLIVLNVNDRPEIITEDKLTAKANILYFVDYNATDIDSPLSQLTWSLNSNATWLGLDSSTGVLSGTPVISDKGWFNVNITVDDGDEGQDWHNFIITVTSEGIENDPPEIITIDKVSTTAGTSYNVIYEAIDDRTPLESLLWSYDSNASWLSFNKLSRTLSGNPTLSDVGWYWVNITVFDDGGKFDSRNFTLTVWATANQPPEILTEDDINAVVDELYSVDYEAEDDHTPIDKLVWSLETNTSEWLGIDPKTGVLRGTPKLEDVGSYWVKVSVDDGEDGWDFSNFTLYVTTEPITDFKPELRNPSMTPTSGDTNTEFTFSVDYSHPNGDPPDSIQVVIDGEGYDMTSTNGHYEYKTKLSEGNHTYYFTTRLGNFKVDTDTYNIGHITKAEGQPEDGDGDDEDENTMFYTGIGIVVIIIIVVLILLFIFLKKKKGKEEEPPMEEVQPPPPEELPEVLPEQPPIPEVPPEQVPSPETPPSDQPQVPPEQPTTTEVTPQVPQPQVEPAPTEPAPSPLVEEQPVTQPQAEQQPQGQAPVPNMKNPIIEEEN
jgi:outer membrane protein assembly factor BamB